MARKTIEVKKVVEMANKALAKSESEGWFGTVEYKYGVVTMLEQILHKTGNYHGFMFLDNEDSKIDTPGYLRRKYFS